MSIKDLLELLKINKKGTYSNARSYVIDLADSEEYGRIYSLLDDNPVLNYQEDLSQLNINNSNFTYTYKEEYQINLMSDFNEDLYTLVIVKL